MHTESSSSGEGFATLQDAINDGNLSDYKYEPGDNLPARTGNKFIGETGEALGGEADLTTAIADLP